jgi:hypothetical protein
MQQQDNDLADGKNVNDWVIRSQDPRYRYSKIGG